jgi:hypothetical protein
MFGGRFGEQHPEGENEAGCRKYAEQDSQRFILHNTL